MRFDTNESNSGFSGAIQPADAGIAAFSGNLV